MSRKIMLFLLLTSVFLLSVPATDSIAAEAFNAYVERLSNSSRVVDVVITWTTDGAGNFTAVALSTKPPFDAGYPVFVQFAYTNPLGTGPTDDYDLSFVSSELSGLDVFGEDLYDRDTLNEEMVEITLPYTIVDLNKVTFDVLAAGADNSGIVRLRCIKTD